MRIILSIFLTVFMISCSSSKKKAPVAEEKQEVSGETSKESKIPTTESHSYAKSVKTKIRERGKDISECYTEAIKKADDLVGKVYFSWDIMQDGTIEELRVNSEKSSIRNEDLETCMMSILSEIQYDVLVEKDVLHVNYPFKFTGKKKK